MKTVDPAWVPVIWRECELSTTGGDPCLYTHMTVALQAHIIMFANRVQVTFSSFAAFMSLYFKARTLRSRHLVLCEVSFGGGLHPKSEHLIQSLISLLLIQLTANVQPDGQRVLAEVLEATGFDFLFPLFLWVFGE